MNQLIIYIILIIILYISINLIRIIYKYYRKNTIRYTKNEINEIVRYKNNQIIKLINDKNQYKKVIEYIGFNIRPSIFNIINDYNYWLSNNYERRIYINGIRYKCNNEYFYLMKFKNNKDIQKIIRDMNIVSYYMIDNKYKQNIRSDWDDNLYHYQSEFRMKELSLDIISKNEIYLNKELSDYQRELIKDEINKNQEDIILTESKPDISFEELKEVGNILIKDIYMFISIYQKFNQNEYLKYQLLNTYDKIIIYHTIKNNKYWGDGELDQSITFTNSLINSQWRYGMNNNGYNILGQIIMLVREILKDKRNEILDEYTIFIKYSEFFIKMCLKYNYRIYKN